MFCIKCGVKLADTEKSCPLCGTTVYHPEVEREPSDPLYPETRPPKKGSGRVVLCGSLIIIFLIPIIISFFSDLQTNGVLDWFGFVAGGLVTGYLIFALPIWFKKPNPVIFVPCSFASAGLYLWYINAATDGEWFLSFALPVLAGLCIICSAITSLLRYLKGGRLYIFGGASIALGCLLPLTEALIKLTFGVRFVGWSIYPFVVLLLLGFLFVYLGINKTAREAAKRKFFF
jgi:hypothetical protein